MKKTNQRGGAVRCLFECRRVLAYPSKDVAGRTVWSEYRPGDKVIFRPSMAENIASDGGDISPWPDEDAVHCVRALDLSAGACYQISGRRWAGVYLVGHFGVACADGSEVHIPPYALLPLAEVQANNRARLHARKGGEV